jgi:hypothetical protein
MVTFTVSFNTSSFLSSNACCTVSVRTHNTLSLIGKQVVYGLTLADYQVSIKFKVNHMRVCDAGIIDYCIAMIAMGDYQNWSKI